MIYTMENVHDFLSTIDKENIIMSHKQAFYNLPCAFDIETTSFYVDGGRVLSNKEYRQNETDKAEKRAIMYVWQFAIGGNVIFGRYWREFRALCDSLAAYLDMPSKKLVVYVHNLAYEYQFFCNRFEWLDVFADSERKPMRAETLDGFVFKCSYRLSGYSLAVVARNLQTHKIEKMVGDLDYDLLRNSKTPLTEEEIGYCVNDVLILTAYISEQIAEWGNIENIPLTQTGKVRRFVRERCFKNKKYRFFIQKLTLEKAEYIMLHEAFAGGFTHCNAMYTEQVLHDVTSYDFTSSYPTVLIAEKYPMSKGKAVRVEHCDQLDALANGGKAFVVNVKLDGLRQKFLYDGIISSSKCRNAKNVLVNNGRVVSAETVTITITDVDYLCIKDFYDWDNATIGLCYVYEKDYLPKEIVDTILELYGSKTTLKDVEEKATEYLHSKELLNSIYGMCVTSIVHDVVTYAGGQWHTAASDIDTALEEYNTDYNRFLFYNWGVWCTAYARANLYTGIRECGRDYVYADTDSVKILNAENHKPYFDRYNAWIVRKLEKCLTHYGFDIERMRPKTIKGKEKPLGVWDFDGHYDTFKTLGAKRYMYEHGGKLSITVAGLSKQKGRDFIAAQSDSFAFFSDGMYIEREATGKMIHTYIDRPIEGFLTDYKGNTAAYSEKSFIHLEKTDYLLSLSAQYIDYFTKQQKRLFR